MYVKFSIKHLAHNADFVIYSYHPRYEVISKDLVWVEFADIGKHLTDCGDIPKELKGVLDEVYL